jgi:hypothetical protein
MCFGEGTFQKNIISGRRHMPRSNPTDTTIRDLKRVQDRLLREVNARPGYNEIHIVNGTHKIVIPQPMRRGLAKTPSNE